MTTNTLWTGFEHKTRRTHRRFVRIPSPPATCTVVFGGFAKALRHPPRIWYSTSGLIRCHILRDNIFFLQAHVLQADVLSITRVNDCSPPTVHLGLLYACSMPCKFARWKA
jgi:hypothetical protein